MRLASKIVIADDPNVDIDNTTKRFTRVEFSKIQRSANFVGACAFWRQLVQLSDPGTRVRFHAMGVLRALAERAYEDCGGLAFSPQEAECFVYCGLTPLGVRSPGSVAITET